MTTTSSPLIRQKKKVIPLIIEPHPRDYTGFSFITLIQYRKTPMLVVIDNMTDDIISAYVLDYCGPEDIDEEMILSIISDWFENNRQNYPISIEFSKRGLTKHVSKIYRTLNVEFITRIIGPIYKFPMSHVRSVKRRRKKLISEGIEIYDSPILEEQL